MIARLAFRFRLCPAGRAPCAGGGHFVTCVPLRLALPLVASKILCRPSGGLEAKPVYSPRSGLVAGFGAGGVDLAAGEFGEDRLQDDVEDRDEEEVEDGGEHHASDDGGTDRVTPVGSGTGGEVERTDAEDKGDGGHQDRAQAEFGGFDSGFGGGAALS